MSAIPARASVASLVSVAFALGWLAGCAEQTAPPELPPRAIQWMRVSDTMEGERRVISGIVTAISDTQLSFEVAGSVKTVEVNLGDQVEKGQVLARLDPEPLELTVRDAEAALADANARQEMARAEFSRTKSLFEADVASRQEYERALALRDSRDSQVEAAQARLNLARRDLRRSVLEAPFSGAISVREVDPAMQIAAGQTVFEMDSDEMGLRVEVLVPETLIARVRQGDEVEAMFPSKDDPRFVAEAGDRSFPALVSEVGNRAGSGNAFPVRADLVESPAGLRPGMTAEVAFHVRPSASGLSGLQGLLIPIGAALAEPDDLFSVFVYDPEASTVSKRRIRTGGVADNEIAVFEGLEGGEIIATAGVSFLRDGQQVTLLQEELIRGRR